MLMLAVQAVLDGKFSSYKAAEMFGIPRSTIYDWVVRAKQTMCTRLNVSDKY
jgi:transposase